ncbi:unnamed protein product [Protopolystoma xenopodis]|uniref:Rrn7/TAF1B C-terminal cyclin domain-containing protein n=1 Tax=Protopolystoma xenopodis TaxID=117903 RepID=A0A448WAE9_9PLAT|nr:unnamed protein product [Protopolystoma xenopodis]
MAKAGDILPNDIFSVHDHTISALFRRNGPPNMVRLTRASYQIMMMLGFINPPLLPLSWLVNRYIRALHLPLCVLLACHELMRLLDRRLVGHLSSLLPSDGVENFSNVLSKLFSLTPWLRYLRGEVFAMAIILVALRWIFKLDDHYEYRLHSVAQHFHANPDCLDRLLKYGHLLPKRLSIELSATPSSFPQPSPFLWVRWVAWMHSRYSDRQHYVADAGSDTLSTSCRSKLPNQSVDMDETIQSLEESLLNTTGIMNKKMDSLRVDLKRKISAPINSARSSEDICSLQTASEFLGDAEFQLDRGDVGYSERDIRFRIVYDVGWQISDSLDMGI